MKTQRTPAETRAAIMQAICDNVQETVINLKCRWMDEKDYEDFNDYKKMLTNKIESVLPGTIKVLSISKSFNIQLQIPEFPYTPEIYCTTTAFGWRSKK